jgi:hypothetical protein
VDDSDLLTEEEADEDGAQPSDVASSSSSKVLLHLQRKTAMQFIGSDNDRVGWGGARRRAKRRHKCENRVASEIESELERREWS